MTRRKIRTHLRDYLAIECTRTMCGLILTAWDAVNRMRSDPKLVSCKRCRTKWDQREARRE